MADYTENYNLKKPERTDFVNIQDINQNMDIIDGALKMVEDSMENSAVVETVEEIKTDLSNASSRIEGIDDKIGLPNDTNASIAEGSLMGKDNKIISDLEIAKRQIEGVGIKVDESKMMLQGESTPYGTGVLGNIVYNSSSFPWGAIDALNRFVIQCKSLTVPEGVTMTPPTNCDMVIIFSQGDVTVNGEIDLRDKRLTTSADTKIQDFITVNDVDYPLAKGGDTVAGGSGGNGGKAVTTMNGLIEASGGNGVTTKKVISGSVLGGGIGFYGEGGKGASFVSQGYGLLTEGKDGTLLSPTPAPCSLVIVSKEKIILNGEINASCYKGKSATSGTNGYRGSDSSGYNLYAGGTGGVGAEPPSGGGAVTLICNEFINNGAINTKGNRLVSPDGQNGTTDIVSNNGAQGGFGGQGGTFISLAGEIRTYEIGGDE